MYYCTLYLKMCCEHKSIYIFTYFSKNCLYGFFANGNKVKLRGFVENEWKVPLSHKKSCFSRMVFLYISTSYYVLTTYIGMHIHCIVTVYTYTLKEWLPQMENCRSWSNITWFCHCIFNYTKVSWHCFSTYNFQHF